MLSTFMVMLMKLQALQGLTCFRNAVVTVQHYRMLSSGSNVLMLPGLL